MIIPNYGVIPVAFLEYTLIFSTYLITNKTINSGLLDSDKRL